MAKNSEITVKDVSIKTMNINGIDYICITDIAKQKNIVDPNGVVANWMCNRNTIEYLGLWETLHNTEFNPLEFEGFRKEASKYMSPCPTSINTSNVNSSSITPKGSELPNIPSTSRNRNSQPANLQQGSISYPCKRTISYLKQPRQYQGSDASIIMA